MRRVLIIAHEYSPCGVTASRRPGGMVKYLREFGWQPVVVTRKWTRDNCNFDASIVPNLPGDVTKYEIDYRDRPTGLGLLATQLVRIFAPFLHPIGYLSAGRKVIDTALEHHHIDAVWTTAPPSNSMNLAQYAARRSVAPLVVDFRDVLQWIPNIFVWLTQPMRVHHEGRMLRNAAAITAVSQGFADTLKRRHGVSVSTVPHGFDEEIWPLQAVRKTPVFNLVYTGSLVLGEPDLAPLLEAIAQLIDAGEISEHDISIEFYGAGNGERIAALLRDYRYRHRVTDFGAAPRERVISLQRQASILLVATHPGMPGWVTSKMFEYLVAQRPVLAIPHDNDCIDQLLRETGAGVSCSTLAEIRQQLLTWYRQWRHDGVIHYAGDVEKIRQYSARQQARKLAQVLDSVVAAR